MPPESIILGAIGVSAVYGLYRSARPWFKVRVNCWFCQADVRVNYNSRNSWVCPGCEQYNGFGDDGDYNRENPDWYREDVTPSHPPPREEERSNGLCQACNLNQSLKVHQLSKFVPRDPARFDEEVEEFSAHLERTYRLCRRCEAIVHQTLGEQDSWLKPKLLSWRLELNRQTVLRSAQIVRQSMEMNREGLALRMFTAAMAILAFLHSLSIPSTDANTGPSKNRTVLFDTSVFIAASAVVQQMFGLFELVSTTVLITLISNLSRKVWNGQRLLNFTSWSILFLLCILTRLEMSDLAASLIPGFTSIILVLSLFNVVSFPLGKRQRIENSKKSLKLRFPQLHDDSHNHHHLQPDETFTQDLVSSVASSPLDQSYCSARDSARGSLVVNGCVREPPLTSLLKSQNPTIDKNPCDISTLSIDDDSDQEADEIRNRGIAPTFSVKPYNRHNSSGIDFGGKKKVVLRPPKFNPSPAAKGVVKTSWVAGGYWECKRNNNPGEAGNVSRSSSQSSGFVSHSSVNQNLNKLFHSQLDLPPRNSQQQIFSLPNSRANSVCGAGDSFSVLSEPAYIAGTPSVNLNQLNFSTSRIAGDERTNSAAKGSFESSLDKLTEEAFAKLKPKAKSSPIPLEEKAASTTSILEKQINCNCSLYSLLLALSVCANVSLAGYFLYNLVI